MFVVIIGFLAAALAVVLFFVAVFSSPPGVSTPPRATSDPAQMGRGRYALGPLRLLTKYRLL